MSIFDWVSHIVPIEQIKKIAFDAGEDIFAQAGAAAYVAASKVIAGANRGKPLQKLDENRKNRLRPNFASLVDTVRIVYGADLIPSINVLGVKLNASTIAQTFGDRIYFKRNYSPDTDIAPDDKINQLIQLSHELVHSRQYHNRGESLHKFGEDYFRGYYEAGFSYSRNKMEADAFDFDACFQTKLFSKIIVPERFRSTMLIGLTSIMPFSLNSQQHFLAYKSSTGTANIGRIHPDGQGIDAVWSTTAGDKWTTGWTAFVPFTLNGKPHYLAYKSGSGQVSIDRVRPNGQGVDTIWPSQGVEKWTEGWTSFVPFLLGGKPHYLAYKMGNGRVAIDRIRPNGQGVDTIWPAQGVETWSEGWTSFVPFVLNSQPHYLAYKLGTGTVHIDRVRPAGDGIENVWQGKWTKGWTSMIAFNFQGAPHILTYKVQSGYTHLERINDGGLGTTTLWCDQWTSGWTAFFPFAVKGVPFHLTYKKESGTVAIDSVNAV